VITRQEILSIFEVDVARGIMTWKNPPKGAEHTIGKQAGWIEKQKHNDRRFVRVQINGRSYSRSRIIFLVAHGRWPHPMVDHINRDSTDDRICNLREATASQNARNTRRTRTVHDLPQGAYQAKNRFQSSITVDKRAIYLGSFETAEDAHKAYVAAKKVMHGEFSGY
jgi:hypothetical protein